MCLSVLSLCDYTCGRALVCVRVMKKRAATESRLFSRLESAAKPQGELAIDFHRLLTEMKDNKKQ